MTDWAKIEKISNKILEKMGGNALEICSGDCPDFAKEMVDSLKNIGIESVIVDNLNSNAMKAELDGYETVESDHDSEISHCYVMIDGWFFDAFDVDGCENESEMRYHTEC